MFIYRDSEGSPDYDPPYAVGTSGRRGLVARRAKYGCRRVFRLKKDLFLPFNEQKYRVEEDKCYLVAVYLDKRDRICATTNVSKYLRTDSPYQKNDLVSGTVYLVKPESARFRAVENRYAGMIPNQELFSPVRMRNVSRKFTRHVRVRGEEDN